jgi:hypothetical protein
MADDQFWNVARFEQRARRPPFFPANDQVDDARPSDFECVPRRVTAKS